MARLPRLIVPGLPHHIVQRGNNRQATFFSDLDYQVYLDRLREYAEQFHVAVHNYVLMTNHVHLLLTPEDELGVSQMMQALGRIYVRYINKSYSRSGTLWEGRFKSSVVNSDDYLFKVSRYIELNPVRANMVQHPAEYPWSSYHGNALGKPIKLLTPHPLYVKLGDTPEVRQRQYQSLFDSALCDNSIEAIRMASCKSWVLGDLRFKQEIQRNLARKVEPGSHGGDRRSKRFDGSSDLTP